MIIDRVVIPAAGLGTRFLPITKAIPKEMLPIGNIPAIHLILEEALASGITNIDLIINNTKQSLRDYLTPRIHSNDPLYQSSNNQKLLAPLDALLAQLHISYIPQPTPKGLGDAVLMAQETIGNHFFGVMLPDDLMKGEIPSLKELMTIAIQYQATVIAVQEIPPHLTTAYGIIGIETTISEGIFTVNKLIEKPEPHMAPSNLGIIGRYILSPAIFPLLNSLKNTQQKGEIQLTDALNLLAIHKYPILAYKTNALRYDIGTPKGWLAANCAYQSNL